MMVHEHVRRAIVIVLRSEDMTAVELLRVRFDPLARSIPAHITLIFPFESALMSAQLRAHMESVTACVPPFKIGLAGITGSEGVYLFLNVGSGTKSIIDLHDRLYAGPLHPHLSTDQAYVPHVTVGRLPNPRALQKAIGEASAADLRVETKAEAISVYQLERDGIRNMEFAVPLKARQKASRG